MIDVGNEVEGLVQVLEDVAVEVVLYLRHAVI